MGNGMAQIKNKSDQTVSYRADYRNMEDPSTMISGSFHTTEATSKTIISLSNGRCNDIPSLPIV
jgi:hypothetical protein